MKLRHEPLRGEIKLMFVLGFHGNCNHFQTTESSVLPEGFAEGGFDLPKPILSEKESA